ncbi:bifunctional diguanylate cyclase/phosphodiesterase [uncultured Castellaniella sp.]|uniref:putative bifunctional diguanylate cyclase/phosphodiesterase n=1 Tax=uncultured Castellaniella sp. TaxID=647907 RepID=UPI00262DD6A2|nr:bifunctional diguanylate cyclase/phosphodiesterase [uncultured Castellaniella sp.]
MSSPKDSATAPLPPPPSRPGNPRVFLAFFLVPLLLGLGLLASAWIFPAHYADQSGQGLSTHFLSGSFDDPYHAASALRASPTRLTQQTPVGPAWLLADLAHAAGSGGEAPQILLLRSPLVAPPVCWLLDSRKAGPLTALDFRAGILGYTAAIPSGTAAADQVMCQLDQVIPGLLSIEQWQSPAVAAATAHHAHALGLLEGGLLVLAAFIAAIALTTRDHMYVLLTCWVLCNLRLGAWALGWDHLWLGHLLSPRELIWSRQLTLLLSFTTTWLLFTRLFQQSLGAAMFRRLQRIGLAFSALLLLPLATPSYEIFQAASFLAAWAGTALVATILIHALFSFTTRSLFWHTLGVCLAAGILVTGLILIALGRSALFGTWLAVGLFLACNLLVALAAANRTREDRQMRLRQRNELIAHDSLSPLGLFTLGATRHFEHLNPNARTMLQIQSDLEIPALSWSAFFPDVDWVAVSLATEQGRDTEIHQHGADPKAPTRSFLLRATLAGSRIEGSLQDVTARTETLRNLRLMTDHDALTNTLNRRGIEDAMQTAIEDLQASGTPCSLSFLSLDHLKRVNDLFGHSAGDQLLQLACDRLKYALNEQQKLGRIGSDEFIILFPRIRAREARRIAQDMLDSLNSSPFYVGDRAFQIKSAMGLIDLDVRMRPKDAIAAATRACRDARKQHQDIVLYEENAHELFDHINELRVFEQLEQGAPPDDIYLAMQPIMSLRHPLQTLNFEVLLRVRSDGEHPLQTQKIIQAAEDSGMITMIDKWVFSTALQWMAKHQLKLGQTQQVNINLSGVSLNDDRFIDMLFGILNQQPQLTRRLCVEITEGVALQDLERTRQFMRRLQRMGARVALDDFGAGYTSFSYLKELPADTIKIDGTLIRDMLSSEANIAIVNSIVDLAHNLGMECIAEWVEDVATLRTLAEMGVDYVQGYAISAARTPSDILAHDNILPLISNPAAQAYIEELSGRRI